MMLTNGYKARASFCFAVMVLACGRGLFVAAETSVCRSGPQVGGCGMQEAKQPIDVGSEKQLFIDRKFIACEKNITLTVNPPQKAGVAIQRDQRWESGAITGGMIFQHGGKVRYYYNANEFTGAGQFGTTRLCYAESVDGIDWAKPVLNQVEYDGSTANNIMENSGNAFFDPQAQPGQQYKMIAICGKMQDVDTGGVYVFSSDDGIRWAKHPDRVFPFWPDGTNQIIYNPKTMKYHVYFRQWIPRSMGTFYTSLVKPLRTLGMLVLDDVMAPWPVDDTVPKFHLWGEGRLPTPSVQYRKVIYGDDHDPPETDIYHGAVVRYPWAADVWLAFPSVFRHRPGADDEGHLNSQLCVSRDGIEWTRYRAPYVGLGLQGHGDNEAIYMGVGLVRNGNELYHYYNGRSVARGAKPSQPGWSEVFRAVQRLDGFVSIDAPYSGGELTTVPLIRRGKNLSLNMDAGATGHVKVEIQNENGNALAGYGLSEADTIRGNHLEKKAKWRGRSVLDIPVDKPIRLRFAMRNCKLYAFQFTDE